MKEIETKFGSLYYEETPADGYALLSSDEKVLFYVENKSILDDFIYDIQNQDTWSDFIQYLVEYTDQPIMYALKLKDLKDSFYEYNIEANNKCPLTKSKCNKIVNEDYVIIGKHYMLFDFIEY